MEHLTRAPPDPMERPGTDIRLRDFGVPAALLAAAAASFVASAITGVDWLTGGTYVFAMFAIIRLWRVVRAHVTAAARIGAWLTTFRSTLVGLGIGLEVSISVLVGTLLAPPIEGVETTLGYTAVFAVTVYLSTSAMRAIWTEEGRKRVRSQLARFGVLAPFVYPVGLFIQVLLLFMLVTSALAANGAVAFAQHEPSNASIGAFYCWHFLDLVPLVHIPETLRWAPPLSYGQWSIGLLVLGFQLSGVFPVIALIRAFWRERSPAEAESNG